MDAGEGLTAIVVITDGDVECVVGRIAGERPELGLVAALARLQLLARRSGCSIRLEAPCPVLRELVELVGLSEVLGGPALPLEPHRQAEGFEELGIEEVVQPGDPPV